MTEDYGTIDEGLGNTGLTLSTTDTNNLRSAGKWGRFIAISGLVVIGLAVLMMLFFGGTLLTMMSMSDTSGMGMGVLGSTLIFIPYAIIFAISIFVYWKLLTFSTNAIKAADSGSSQAMSASVSSLKSMLKIVGVLWALYLGLIALSLVFGLLGGLATLFM